MNYRQNAEHVKAMWPRVSNHQAARADAWKEAKGDREKGLGPDPGRHLARPNSAWSEWYNESFEELEGEQ